MLLKLDIFLDLKKVPERDLTKRANFFSHIKKRGTQAFTRVLLEILTLTLSLTSMEIETFFALIEHVLTFSMMIT